MNTRMKIAFVSQPWNDVAPPVQSGSIAIWTYEVARRLARSCDVIVYAKRRRHQKKVETHEGVQYRHIPIGLDTGVQRLLKPCFRFRSAQRPLFASPLYYLSYIRRIAADVQAQQCDIVHLFNFSQFAPLIRAFNPHVKIVLRMSCEWLTQLDRTLIERRLQDTDLIIGCSEYITAKIRKRFPHASTRCQTVYNGRDVHHFVQKSRDDVSRLNGDKNLLFVGRVTPEKGVHVLLEAFQRVVAQYPKVQLTIVGPHDSTPREFVIALSNDPKVADLSAFYAERFSTYLHRQLAPSVAEKVHFTGSIPFLELVQHYQNADAFIFPSIWDEPSGNPPIEAMAAGIPVVSTCTGGTPEYVEHGKTGLLVEAGDVQQLTNAILSLLENEDLRQSMGEAARQRAVQYFSCERMAENLLYQYKTICQVEA